MVELFRDNIEVDRRRIKDGSASGSAGQLAQNRWEVPDIPSWIQCFGVYACIVAAVQPDKTQQLLAYQTMEVREARPGPNGIPYFVWKSSTTAPELLSAIFNTCCINRKTPDSWKASDTILIYKKGDTTSPSNWRPISLQPTIYKIYAAVLSRRLASWAQENRIES